MKLRIGIDVGGTFTDVTAFDEDRGEVIAIRKYLSNPAEPMKVMDEVMGELAKEFGPNSVSLILHGSTAALNALLEGKGVKTGLLTTKGFRDVYEIGRQWRGEEVFNMFAPAPKMLLTRDRIFGITERLDYQGKVIEKLNEAEVVAAVKQLAAQDTQAIAVSFLFSYANPAHEQRVAQLIHETAPGIYVSLSSTVNPEWREYERTASTVANANIGPRASKYLLDLEALTAKHLPQARVLMMKSDGGAASAAMLSPTPIQTVMSGPVAGVIGTRYLGDVKGVENLLSFDTGGTSSDMAVIPGLPLFKSQVTVGRHPVRTSAVDIDTIGAGGGSIASIQLGGVLKVGPESAGANPGPACYNRGGTEATLTDALVVLGHLNPRALLLGAMPIDRAKAEKAVMDHVGAPLKISAVEAAWGILTVLTTNCVMAMRTITVERGYDPREFALVPFGGMGPTVGARIARELGVRRLLIPRDPGTFSAYGMLVTDVQQERSFTRLTPLDKADPAELDGIYRKMEESAIADLKNENLPAETLRTTRYAGMRYSGQSYEVNVLVDALKDRSSLDEMAKRFHGAHERRYGHAASAQVELVNFKVVGVGVIPKPVMKKFASSANKPTPAEIRTSYFDGKTAVQAPVYLRDKLEAGMRFEGPAVIEEKTSTTVLYPGDTAVVDAFLNIEVELKGAG